MLIIRCPGIFRNRRQVLHASRVRDWCSHKMTGTIGLVRLAIAKKYMESLLPLITQLIAGAADGNAIGTILRQQATSFIVRTILDAIGGIG